MSKRRERRNARNDDTPTGGYRVVFTLSEHGDMFSGADTELNSTRDYNALVLGQSALGHPADPPKMPPARRRPHTASARFQTSHLDLDAVRMATVRKRRMTARPSTGVPHSPFYTRSPRPVSIDSIQKTRVASLSYIRNLANEVATQRKKEREEAREATARDRLVSARAVEMQSLGIQSQPSQDDAYVPTPPTQNRTRHRRMLTARKRQDAQVREAEEQEQRRAKMMERYNAHFARLERQREEREEQLLALRSENNMFRKARAELIAFVMEDENVDLTVVNSRLERLEAESSYFLTKTVNQHEDIEPPPNINMSYTTTFGLAEPYKAETEESGEGESEESDDPPPPPPKAKKRRSRRSAG